MDVEIFDKHGKVAGWIVDGEDIFSRSNHYIGFIEGDGIFGPRAKYLGEFSNGFIWDKDGKAVAFVDGASNGPSTPLTQLTPLSPLHAITPLKPLTSITPIHPTHSNAWSQSTFSDLFS